MTNQSFDGDHDHDGAGDFFFSLYYYLVSWSRSLWVVSSEKFSPGFNAGIRR